MLWAVKAKAQTGRHLTVRQRASNRRFGKVCAKVEHVFRVLKCQFGYRKVRYRGLTKNAAQVFSLLALAYRAPGRIGTGADGCGADGCFRFRRSRWRECCRTVASH